MAKPPPPNFQPYAGNDLKHVEDLPKVVTHPKLIRAFSLTAAKKAIKLEAMGLRHSRIRGGVKNLWAAHLGMPVRSTHEAVIARLEEEIAKLKKEYEDEHQQQQFPL